MKLFKKLFKRNQVTESAIEGIKWKKKYSPIKWGCIYHDSDIDGFRTYDHKPTEEDIKAFMEWSKVKSMRPVLITEMMYWGWVEEEECHSEKEEKLEHYSSDQLE